MSNISLTPTARAARLHIAGAVIASGLAGWLLAAGTIAPADTAPPVGPVAPINVAITYDANGEAQSVELTDADGLPVHVGSVAEEWPHLAVDYSTEAGVDQ